MIKIIKETQKLDRESYILYCIWVNNNSNNTNINYIEICYSELLDEYEVYNYDEYLYGHGKTYKLFSNSRPSHFLNMGPFRNGLHYALFLNTQREFIK